MTRLSYDDPLLESNVVQAHQLLVGMRVNPTFAGKLILALPRDPLVVQLIAVLKVLACSPADLRRWLAQLQDLNRPAIRHIPYVAGSRDALFHAFHEALTQVNARMPTFWPWLMKHSRTGRKGYPSEPPARLFMALVVAHLQQHGHRVDYQTLAHVVRILFPGALHTQLTSKQASDSVRVRSSRFWKDLDPSAFLAAVNRFTVRNLFWWN